MISPTRAVAVACLLAVVLGAAGARVTTALLTKGTDDSRLEAVVPELRFESELLAEIRELRDANRELRDRLAVLESRPAPVMRQPALELASQEDLDALREEVLAWMARPDAAVPTAPELKDRVADALLSLRKEEAVEKTRRYQEESAARLEERVASWSEWLDLDDYQSNELRAVLGRKDELDRELLRLWEEGADDEVLAEVKGSNHRQFTTAVASILTPQQLATFRTKFGDSGD